MIGLLCCVLLSNCSKDVLPGDYDSSDVGKVKKVVPGTLLSMRPVRLHRNASENLAKHASPDSGYTDNSLNRSHGYEYVIKLNSGSIVSVVQTDAIKLKHKQHVLIIYGANTHVVPDNGSEDY